MAIRLLAIDVDGTLLDRQGHLPPANRAAVEAAIGRGVEVMIVTGRSHHFVRPIADLLPGPIELIVNNGALVKDADGRTLLARPMPQAVALDVLAVTRDFRGDAGIVFDRTGSQQVVYESVDSAHPGRRAYFERNRAFLDAISPLELALTDDPVAVVFNGAVDRMRALAGVIDRAAIRASVEVTSTEYEARDFALVDVLARGCSKGSTLSLWAARRGLDRSQVMAVGDNLNDLEMLEFAGLPVVMGNGVDALKNRGWAVTGTHDDAGLAQAIERYVLSGSAGL